MVCACTAANVPIRIIYSVVITVGAFAKEEEGLVPAVGTGARTNDVHNTDGLVGVYEVMELLLWRRGIGE